MAEHYKVELGQAIRRRREELGLTQKQLADRTNHQEAQTVSRWERGENAPADLEVVADALQWTLAELVAGIEPPTSRTARRLGQTPEAQPSQLDRIESRLDEIYALLTGDPADSAEPGVGGLADRLLSADESPPRKAGGRSGSRPGARRRSVA